MTFALSTVATALALIQGGGQVAGPLTLEQALAIAERNAFAVRLQQSQVEKSRQRLNEARANGGPKVSVTGTYTRFSEAQTTSFGGGPAIVVQPIDNKQVTAALTLPIDISGNLRRLVDAAREQAEASRHSLRATTNDVRLNTKVAYFNVLRAEGFVSVAQAGLRDAEERRNQAERLYRAAQIAKVDLDRFETQVAQARADLIAAENALQLARQQFNLSLARPIETPVQLAPIARRPDAPKAPDPLVAVAQSQRAEVLALQDNVEALALIRRAQEGGMSPSLALSLQHQRNIDAQGFSSRAQQTFGTLQISIPLFDSGVTRARARQAREDEEQAKINLEQLRLGISHEVRTAMANLEGAQARLTNAEAQVRLAEEVFRLAKVRQDAGAGTYVEVIDAETALTQARNQRVAAEFDYLTAYAQLQRAVGTEDLSAARPVAPGGTKNTR